jgi:hypothetical protein
MTRRCVAVSQGVVDWSNVDLKSQEHRVVNRQLKWSALVCGRFSLPVVAAMVSALPVRSLHWVDVRAEVESDAPCALYLVFREFSGCWRRYQPPLCRS